MTLAGLFWLMIAGFWVYRLFRGRPEQRRERPDGWAAAEESPPQTELVWPSEEIVVDTAVDPVCGAYVSQDASIMKSVAGTAYHFCGEACAARFEELHKQAI